MRPSILLFIVAFILYSCQENEKVCTECEECGLNLNVKEQSLDEALVKSKSSSGSLTDSTELKESIAKIEEKYGEQWDFCHCVVVNDSIDKAIKGGNSDDKLMARWDVVDKKCQAFRIQDPSRTPEERDAHERRVRKCLKSAGIR